MLAAGPVIWPCRVASAYPTRPIFYACTVQFPEMYRPSDKTRFFLLCFVRPGLSLFHSSFSWMVGCVGDGGPTTNTCRDDHFTDKRLRAKNACELFHDVIYITWEWHSKQYCVSTIYLSFHSHPTNIFYRNAYKLLLLKQVYSNKRLIILNSWMTHVYNWFCIQQKQSHNKVFCTSGTKLLRRLMCQI